MVDIRYPKIFNFFNGLCCCVALFSHTVEALGHRHSRMMFHFQWIFEIQLDKYRLRI